MLSAAYLLQLESEHKLTRGAMDSVVSTTSDLQTSHISSAQQEIRSNWSKMAFSLVTMCLTMFMWTVWVA